MTNRGRVGWVAAALVGVVLALVLWGPEETPGGAVEAERSSREVPQAGDGATLLDAAARTLRETGLASARVEAGERPRAERVAGVAGAERVRWMRVVADGYIDRSALYLLAWDLDLEAAWCRGEYYTAKVRSDGWADVSAWPETDLHLGLAALSWIGLPVELGPISPEHIALDRDTSTPRVLDVRGRVFGSQLVVVDEDGDFLAEARATAVAAFNERAHTSDWCGAREQRLSHDNHFTLLYREPQAAAIDAEGKMRARVDLVPGVVHVQLVSELEIECVLEGFGAELAEGPLKVRFLGPGRAGIHSVFASESVLRHKVRAEGTWRATVTFPTLGNRIQPGQFGRREQEVVTTEFEVAVGGANRVVVTRPNPH